MADEKTSIWKKEISFRRKKATPVPAAPVPPARPESVAELLRPVALSEPEAGIPLPPVSPAPVRSVSAPANEPPVSGPPPIAPAAGLPPPVLPSVAEEQSADAAPADEPAPAASEPQPPPAVGSESPAEPAAAEPVVDEPAEPAPELPDAPGGQERPAKLSRRERKAAESAAKERARRRQASLRGRHVHKQVVGLKIGASQIAAAEISNKGGPRLVTFARTPLPQGVVVGGEVRDPDRLASELRALFRKRKLPRKNVRLGIANNRIAMRIFEIAGIDDEKQFANAVRYRAQEALPIPLDEAVLDYQLLDDRVDEQGVRQRRVLLVVAHKGLVESYVAVCKAAGIKLIGVDLEAFALLRALTPADFGRVGEDAGLVVVSVGAERATLAVSDGRSCEYTRVLDWGGSSLDAVVARALEIEPHEAEPLKRVLGLGDGAVAELEAEAAARAREAMRAEVHAFARELVSSLRFYQEQPGSLGIAEIFLTGGGAQLGGLAEELERAIGVRASVGDPLADVKLPRKLRKRRHGPAGSLAAAVGLGIEV